MAEQRTTIATEHELVTHMRPKWQKVLDCCDGEDAIKDRGQSYLPLLSGMKPLDYLGYKYRAVYSNIPGFTSEGYMGLIFRNPPRVQVPEKFKKQLANITLSGVHIENFIYGVVRALITPGRTGILTTRLGESLPYLTEYSAPNIVNWWESPDDGNVHQCVLRELIEDRNVNGFGVRKIEQYRELKLVPAETKSGFALVSQLYRRPRDMQDSTNKQEREEFQPFGEEVPFLRFNEPVEFIPFVPANPTSINYAPEMPPLLDLCNMALAHYRNSADRENALHIVGVPQPCISGVSAEGAGGKPKVYRLGSGTAWTFTKAEAKAYFLEYAGQGLGPLKEAMEEKERLMILLGARLIDSKKAQEAAQTVRMRQSSQTATLKSIASTAADAVRQSLAFWLWWQMPGVSLEEVIESKDLIVEVNTSFEDEVMTGPEISALVESWQRGAISLPSVLWNFKRGGRIPPDRTEEEEMKLIESTLPPELRGFEREDDKDNDDAGA